MDPSVEAPPDSEGDAPAAPEVLAPAAETWRCQVLVLSGSSTGLRGLAARLPGACGLRSNTAVHTATVSSGCLSVGPHTLGLSPDLDLQTLAVGDKHTALVLHHTEAAAAALTLTLYGFESAEEAARLAAAVASERDARRFPKAAALPDGVATAVLASLWRRMSAGTPQSWALREAYLARSWGSADGQHLFCALWRLFTSLLAPQAYDPACGATPQAASRAADAFTQLLTCATQADLLARLLLLSPQWGPSPDSLAAWARTPVPDARDFAKLVACMDSGARALHRAKPLVLPLLLGLSAEVGAVPPTSPDAATLFGPHGCAWFAACDARDAGLVATSSVERFLLCVSPVAALYAATAAAARADAAALQLALAQSSGPERLAGLLDLDAMASLSAVFFSVPHTAGPSFLVRCAVLLVTPCEEAGTVHPPCLVLALTRWGVAHGGLRATFHILESILFEPDAVTLTPFGAAALQPDADMPLCDLLAGAVAACVASTPQTDLLCGLLELVLRCSSAAPPPAAQLTPTPRVARCDPAFLATLPALPPRLWPALASRLRFTRYLMRVHSLSGDALAAPPGSSRGGGGPNSRGAQDGPDSRASLDEPPPSSNNTRSLPGTAEDIWQAAGDADSGPPSTESWLVTWHTRSRGAALAACLAYVSLCVRQRPSGVQRFLVTAPDWQGTLLSSPAERAQLAATLTTSPQFRLLWPAAVTSLVEGDATGLLRHHSHWHPDALRALCLPSVVAQGASLVADAPWLCPRVKEADDDAMPVFASPAEDGGAAAPVGGGVASQRQKSLAEHLLDGGRQLLRDMRRRDTVEESVGEIPQDSLETPGGDGDGEAAPQPNKIPDIRLFRISLAAMAMRRRSSSAPAAAETPAAEPPTAEAGDVANQPVALPPPPQQQEDGGGGFMSRFRRRKTLPPPASDAPPPSEVPQPESVAAPEGGEVDSSPGDSAAIAAAPSASLAIAAIAAPPDSVPVESAAVPPEVAAEQRMQDAQLVFELVELGLYLKKAARLDADVIDLFVNMNDQRSESAGAELHKRSVLMLLEDVRQRRINNKTGDFFDARRAGRPAVLDMGTINECACFARDALAMLASQPVSQGKLRGVFSYYVDRAPPAAWTGLFKGTSTISFFLKYLDRESFPQAFAAFREENTRADRDPSDAALFATLMTSVAATYTAPLFTLQADTLSDDAKVSELIEQIRGAGVADGPTVLGMLRRVTAGWMELSKSKFQVPMAPRNAQIISCLLCCEWVRRRLDGHPSVPEEQRTFVTRVGTGEGKSLIIAMIAIYVVQILKKRVHVMEANEALLLRDVAEMKPFYSSFGISVSANFGGFLRDEKADITYCCRRELNVYYRNHLSKNPLGNTVLILDEVDQLIVDESPNQSYVTKDIERSPAMQRMFDTWRSGGDDSQFESDDIKARVKQRGYVKGEELRASGQYARVQEQDPQTGEMKDVYVELDAKGKPMRGFYFASCEYLNYVFQGVPPQFKSHYFYQSMPFMMNQYEAILGLSGSLGSPSEQVFMKATYGARTMLTPPFLNTCQAMRKHVARLHGDRVVVHDTRDAQFAAIRRLALQFRDQVPVVVLANEVGAAKALFADCFTDADREAGTIQLFLELDPATGKPADYGAVVKEATRPRQSAASPSGSIWPVTVSDPFGGRGQDYTVLKEEVDKAGGIMVICTAIPDSEREWIQWLGRTARSDRRGQYAVVLLSSDSPLKDVGDARLRAHSAGAPGVYQPSLLKELLDERDTAIKKKLDGLEKQLAHGMRMHEVCYAFWKAQPKGCEVANYPADDVQKLLRGFVEKNSAMSTVEAVCDFAAAAGLVATPEEWRKMSKCCGK